MSDTLFIVDTMYQIFKNFYALGGARGLRSAQGVPTSAVYGLAKTLRSWRTKLGMDYCICAFESSVPVFRREISPLYKANRPPLDPDLKVQIPLAMDMCRHLGYKVIYADGYEADDIIGTLSASALKKGWKVRVLSKDKDFAQLLALDGDIAIMLPAEGKSDEHYVDKSNCQDNYCGVPAELIVDWLALMGDASDNIIGVKGIGEKTGAKLINKFGSLENIIERADLCGRFAVAIKEAQDRLKMNKVLASIRQDAPLPVHMNSLEEFKIQNPGAAAESFCQNLGIKFASLI
ncbi:MAG: 5'-3' exonuclease H3TH domain-containing protein [Candidatus Bruticola sp.]